MTFDEFIAKYTNQPVDFDGVYPNQCMDLMHSYVYEVLGLTDRKLLAHPCAYQVFTDFTEAQYFDKIANTPEGIPQKGDIILFNKTSSNPYGHVCIFVEGTASKFKSFDANYPTGSLPHIQDHTYGYCLGWLRYKGAPDTINVLKTQFEELVRKSTIADKVASTLGKEVNESVILGDLTRLIKLEDAVVEKDRKINELQTAYDTLHEQLVSVTAKYVALSEAHDETVIQLTEATKKADDTKKSIDIMGQTIASLTSQVESLKKASELPIFSGWKKFIVEVLSRI